ncbi:MAG: AMP-binding protein [Eubacteriales bacterium]|nr:AMP-binding protein [Eubacteriales bacterium]
MRRYFEAIDDLMLMEKTMESIFIVSKRFSKIIAIEHLDSNGKIIQISYKSYFERIYKTASNISEKLKEIEYGSVVGLKLNNSPLWGVFFWALLMCGYRPMLLDAKAGQEPTNSLLLQANAKALVTEDADTFCCPKFSTPELLSDRPAKDFMPRWEDHVLFCSSGTTGNSTVVVFNGECLCYQIASAKTMPDRTLDIMYPPSMGNLKVLAMLPFHHIFGFVAVFLWYTFFGKTVVYLADLLPGTILETCRRLKVSHVYGVPLLWNNIAQTLVRKAELGGKKRERIFNNLIAYHTHTMTKRQAGYGASRSLLKTIQQRLLGPAIKFCISGGGHITYDTLKIINGVGYPLYNGYGLTEVGVTSVELDPDVTMRMKASIGRPLYKMAYKIVPISDQDETTGELCIKSQTTHIGTMQDGVFIKRGDTEWYKTGDIVTKDDKGNYYIKGRIRDIIINADGENVFPDELESCFAGLPFVAQLCVLGIQRRNESAERITLILELSGDITADEQAGLYDKIREINGTLPIHKQVQDTYVSSDILPVINTIKIQRHKLRHNLAEHPERFQRLSVIDGKVFKDYPKDFIEEILTGVRTVFADVLHLPVESVYDHGHFVYDLGGDSLMYAGLILELENHFNTTIPQQSYGKCYCVNDFSKLIADIRKN